jgi:hypothetical protein
MTDVDEMFLVWRANSSSSLETRSLCWDRGELVIVPRGIEHRTAADEEAEVILLEPAGVLNTGNATDEMFTAPMGARI